MNGGSFIETASGRRIDPINPHADDIDISDIARALAHQCRFGGHCRVFYSVAQHASIVSDVVHERTDDASDGLWALLHDAAEAYLVDLPHPLKHRSELGRLFRETETRLQTAILDRYSLPPDPPTTLKEVDRALLAAERELFTTRSWPWPELEGVIPLEVGIDPWGPDRAASEFLARFDLLDTARRGSG